MSISDLFDSEFKSRNKGHFSAIVRVALADGVMADCRLGEGRVTIIADAALFDAEEDELPAATELAALFQWVFGNPVPPLAPFAEPRSN